jgi:chemotaxis-related protein WspD
MTAILLARVDCATDWLASNSAEGHMDRAFPIIQSEAVSSHYCWRTIGVYGDHSCKRLHEFVHCRNCPVFAGAAREALNRPNPSEVLGEERRMSVSGNERRKEARQSALVFKLGNELLGLDTQLMTEVAGDKPARRVAHRAGGLIEGLVNIRGELQLCLSLHGILGIEPQSPVSGDRSRLMVTRHDNQTWVFRVAHVRGVSSFSASQLQAPPKRLTQQLSLHVRGVVRLDGYVVSVLSSDSLFDAFQRAVFE